MQRDLLNGGVSGEYRNEGVKNQENKEAIKDNTKTSKGPGPQATDRDNINAHSRELDDQQIKKPRPSQLKSSIKGSN